MKDEGSVDAEPDYQYYTEISTNLIYEVKLFDTFAFLRPATPTFHAAVNRMDLEQFNKEFREFYGDHEGVREFLKNNDFIHIQ